MIWCRFQFGATTAHGVVKGETVTEVEGLPWGEHRITSRTYPLAEVKLLVPVIPGTFYCAGVNYAAHVIGMAKRRGAEPKLPQKPDIGYRANNALVAHEENIVKPKDSGTEFQYEGELVAVFGKKAKHVSKEGALDCVFGWTIGNDVSERTWQRGDRTMWRGKNSDTFKPMGPWIVSDLDGVALKEMKTTVRLNGQQVDFFDTANMIFDPAAYISEVTKYITLYPGDVMWFGTDGLPQNMKPGDLCEIEISGIGVLRNRVVAEK